MPTGPGPRAASPSRPASAACWEARRRRPRTTSTCRRHAAEARDVDAQYAPQTTRTDGWAVTRNSFEALFSTVAVVLCFPHGFLKIRDRCRKDRDLHRRVWDVYRAATAEEFRRLMEALRDWCDGRTWTTPVREMLAKLRNRTDAYAVAYDHPGCRRTSNAVDRPINRLRRLLYAGRGLHGHQGSSERRLRGWALLHDFRPIAPRSGPPRPLECPALRLGGKRCYNHWLRNLMTATSVADRRNPAPAMW